MSWAWQNRDQIGHLLVSHLYLALVPVVFGIIVAIPVGIMCVRWRWTWPPILSLTSIFYALPSLALYLVLIAYTGLTDWTVIIPLTLFSLSVLIPNVVDGLRSVPQPVQQAAVAMGFGRLRQTIQVELPLAVPIIIAGLRVATVSSISLVSVGQLIGIGGLGYFFTDGEQRDFSTEIYVGLVLIILLALLFDGLLVLARRWLTPWEAGRAPRGERRRAVTVTLGGSAAGLTGGPRAPRGPCRRRRRPRRRRGTRMSYFSDAWQWLISSQNWHGSNGIPERLAQHLEYTAIALAIALVIAIPVGLAMGHLRRGGFVVVTVANFGRALPTLGLVVLVFVLTAGSAAAWLVPLAALAIPPMLVNTYEGVLGVDRELTDAARGMGMTEWQILRKVEIPVALPLILLGIRTSAIQVVATATIAAYIGLGGLGRYIIDGLARNEYNVVAGGAAVIVLLALAVQGLFMLLAIVIVPVGLRRQAQAS